MVLRVLIFISTILALSGCLTSENYSLDSSIPRIETTSDQIAYLRTKWKNGKHIETALYDEQDRLLEVFSFGRSSLKLLNRYEGKNNTTAIHYYHNDSSTPGFIEIDTLRREFDSNGRVVAELHVRQTLSQFSRPKMEGFYRRYLAYSIAGDTIIKKSTSSYKSAEQDPSQVANIIQWERDDKKRLRRYYRLYVTKGPHNPQPDTIYHFSQRYAYDSAGRLKTAWFDNMHLGRFYLPAGPDTIQYQYNSQNRLIEERHRYTTDLRNKKEIDTTRLSASDRKSIQWYKKKFFVGDSIFHNNNKIDIVEYRYEVFDPAKHLPLAIPAVD